jgi:hypothetical protein
MNIAMEALQPSRFRVSEAGRRAKGSKRLIVALRYENDNGRVEEFEWSLDLRDISRSWEQGPEALRPAGVVAEFAEILKGSYWARDSRLDVVAREVEALSRSGDYRGDDTVEELADLVKLAARLQRESERKRDALEEELRRLDQQR